MNVENSIEKKCNKGWDLSSFLTFRIFLLFEICIGLRQEGTNQMRLPRDTTFKQNASSINNLLGNAVYEWFRNQECKSFVFNKTDYNTVIDEEKNSNQSIMSGSASKIKGENTLNINAIQNEVFYSHDEPANQIYFQLYSNLTERDQFHQLYSIQISQTYSKCYRDKSRMG
ncbi:hypothetical protein RFI_25729 [Reticulomyxa filosa]|uniref:Uncharacterized protein n=1 Tax=Reticulomyxa filosa TaxID=46433 RepID=X6MDZ2_RETFI|nr:hypothetical protein RFI_25729 [Reticulomyxa filosa]|eukprot:ETO11647.1 hypothetical protein RFI_25729 [Reticulomyxa filosa]